ncbi:hypothetical protein P8C59_008412 [Phyllachora maydis]|uniref:UBZ4-type domain-containing protein n=1 Tax=Phyllachora maydis TaxID=1825666 RepID=A0AAD9IB23_9PEZI|nr:hypothetical protein P8C59_008412 [Phyllachora maydis]
MVSCPVCNKAVKASFINDHLDASCATFLVDDRTSSPPNATQAQPPPSSTTARKRSAASFFQTPAAKRQAGANGKVPLTPLANGSGAKTNGVKRPFDQGPGRSSPTSAAATTQEEEEEEEEQQPQQEQENHAAEAGRDPSGPPAAKRPRLPDRAAPLAERMRPRSLDEVCGQELVGPRGVLRALIESGRVPSLLLWGAAGTGKTTIARCIAGRSGARFVELNATSCGVAECKRLFGEAARELALTGRRTIVFCDELHRFNKAQQDVFLRPVEAGTITLIGATTENPSFRVQAALLSRCRTFTLRPLAADDVRRILARALREEAAGDGGRPQPSPLLDDDMLAYLARFADGDARTALNLLELAMSLSAQPAPGGDAGRPLTQDDLKRALTQTLVYDRAGDQHYDTISAFHKAVRGSDADAALYYLARMLQSGEDPLFVARRMVVIASEDVGLADSSLLPLAVAAFTATQQIGMPEARIPLAHCAVALSLAPKSTRAYRALNSAMSALQEPGVAGLPVPVHLRNAPTRLMRDMGYGAEYKYPPNYRDGKVRQEYMPEGLRGRKFLEARDLGTEVDPDLAMTDG